MWRISVRQYLLYKTLPEPILFFMMTSSNGNIFRVTGHLWRNRGIHRSPVNSPHKGQWRGALMFSLICAWINGSVNNGEAGDLRRYRAHYDVTVMYSWARSPSVKENVTYITYVTHKPCSSIDGKAPPGPLISHIYSSSWLPQPP